MENRAKLLKRSIHNECVALSDTIVAGHRDPLVTEDLLGHVGLVSVQSRY